MIGAMIIAALWVVAFVLLLNVLSNMAKSLDKRRPK